MRLEAGGDIGHDRCSHVRKMAGAIVCELDDDFTAYKVLNVICACV
jgi:hypothetical protein